LRQRRFNKFRDTLMDLAMTFIELLLKGGRELKVTPSPPPSPTVEVNIDDSPSHSDRVLLYDGHDQKELHVSLIRDNHLAVGSGKLVLDRSLYLHWFKKELTKEDLEEELMVVLENFELLIGNLGIITSSSGLFLCCPPCLQTRVPSDRHTWHNNPLGGLLEIWHDRKSLGTCEKCHGQGYPLFALGSPLSGSGNGYGLCRHCKSIQKIGSFGRFMGILSEMRSRCKVPFQTHRASLQDVLQTISGKGSS